MFARFMIFFFGLCVLSLGIATVTNAGLGTGTVSSVAFVLNRLTDFSMGFFVFLTNVFFFVLQVIVDSKDFLKKSIKAIAHLFCIRDDIRYRVVGERAYCCAKLLAAAFDGLFRKHS